jgi:transcriptional regulator with XRE-family HTH domain
MNNLALIGEQLKTARKKRFPDDDLMAFALRIGVSRATLQKMEKGDLSVGLGKYYAAAEVLQLENAFRDLFKLKPSLFDE